LSFASTNVTVPILWVLV